MQMNGRRAGDILSLVAARGAINCGDREDRGAHTNHDSNSHYTRFSLSPRTRSTNRRLATSPTLGRYFSCFSGAIVECRVKGAWKLDRVLLGGSLWVGWHSLWLLLSFLRKIKCREFLTVASVEYLSLLGFTYSSSWHIWRVKFHEQSFEKIMCSVKFVDVKPWKCKKLLNCNYCMPFALILVNKKSWLSSDIVGSFLISTPWYTEIRKVSYKYAYNFTANYTASTCCEGNDMTHKIYDFNYVLSKFIAEIKLLQYLK